MAFNFEIYRIHLGPKAYVDFLEATDVARWIERECLNENDPRYEDFCICLNTLELEGIDWLDLPSDYKIKPGVIRCV